MNSGMALALFSLDELVVAHEIPEETQTYLRLLDQVLSTNKAFTRYYYSRSDSHTMISAMATCANSDGSTEEFEAAVEISDDMIAILLEIDYQRDIEVLHKGLNEQLRDTIWTYRMVYGH